MQIVCFYLLFIFNDFISSLKKRKKLLFQYLHYKLEKEAGSFFHFILKMKLKITLILCELQYFVA